MQPIIHTVITIHDSNMADVISFGSPICRYFLRNIPWNNRRNSHLSLCPLIVLITAEDFVGRGLMEFPLPDNHVRDFLEER